MRARIAEILLSILVGTVLLAACGTSSENTTAETTSSSLSTGAVVIDVRTPAEYAAGHLQGARNISLESGTFAEAISTLPKDAPYIVYCRTGNRSARAVAIMRSQGFTDVTDAGGIDAARERTGLPVDTG